MKTIQTIIMAKLTYIDARIQIIKAEYDGFFYGESPHKEKILRDKIKFYLNDLIQIERMYKLYPNNKHYLIAVKKLAKKELKDLRN